jgi:catechol 2,3-dioxygenase-like lactoylglutathione lyase family enzyme
MPFSIDHIVIASHDLDAAIRNARAAGFTVVAGGVHGSGNTQNALIGFQDGAYLELFAPTPQGRTAEHRWFARIRNGGGLVDFCLLGADLATETTRIRQSGIEYSQPFAMTRVTPDGTRIEWSLSTPPGITGQYGWPFMIEDTTPRPIRVPHAPEQIRHANGSKGVAGITVLVRDLDPSAKAYEAILGMSPHEAAHAQDRVSTVFSLTGAWIRLKEPSSAEEAEHLERHGQGPYRITLRCHDASIAPDAGSLLDPLFFSGAKIAVV